MLAKEIDAILRTLGRTVPADSLATALHAVSSPSPLSPQPTSLPPQPTHSYARTESRWVPLLHQVEDLSAQT